MNGVAGLDWKKIGSFIGENSKTVKDMPYTRKNKEITRCSGQKAQNSIGTYVWFRAKNWQYLRTKNYN